VIVNKSRFSFQGTYRVFTTVCGSHQQALSALSPPPQASSRPAEIHPDQPGHACSCQPYQMKNRHRSALSRQ